MEMEGIVGQMYIICQYGYEDLLSRKYKSTINSNRKHVPHSLNLNRKYIDQE